MSIARCDYCDRQSELRGWKPRIGYRYDPTCRVPLSGFHCGYCGSALRPKVHGEHESTIVSACLGKPRRLPEKAAT